MRSVGGVDRECRRERGERDASNGWEVAMGWQVGVQRRRAARQLEVLGAGMDMIQQGLARLLRDLLKGPAASGCFPVIYATGADKAT